MLSGVSAGNSGMVFRIVIVFDPNGVNDRSCDCGFVDFVLEKKLYSDDVLCNTDFGCCDCFETNLDLSLQDGVRFIHCIPGRLLDDH